MVVAKLTYSILIVHKDGNINSNPNLSEIVTALHQSGFAVDVFSEKNSKTVQVDTSDYRFILVDNFSCLIRDGLFRRFVKPLKSSILDQVSGYDIVVGVDGEGIALAGIIAAHANIPLAFISYEIMFRDEADFSFKRQEIAASQAAAFVVCQDPVRALKLSEENDIPIDKIINIPVAGRALVKPPAEIDYLRKKFSIDQDKKIALYMGTVDAWAGQRALMEDLVNWPDDWVLVVHDRYRQSNLEARFKGLPSSALKKINFSNEPFKDFEDLYCLPFSADIGIALYYPDWRYPETGKNIQYLGWSSGKVATYLQCSLPVIVNDIGVIADDVQKEGVGFVLRQGEQISGILRRVDDANLRDMKINSQQFFSEKLDFGIYREQLMSKFSTLLTGQKTESRIDKKLDIELLLSVYYYASGEFLHVWKFKTERYYKKYVLSFLKNLFNTMVYNG